MNTDTPGKLTVLQALPALEVGGVERGTLEVAAELVRRGHRSIVVSGGGRLVKKLLDAGSEHITLPLGKKSPLTLRHVAGIRTILIRENISILHARSRLPAWICYLAWKTLPANTRPRFVTTFHGPYSPGLYSKIMIRGERIIAVSDYIRRYILHCYPETDESKIRVIHRGVSREEYQPGFRPDPDWLSRWKEQHPELESKYIISLPGRITRRKGHVDFINIIKTLVDDGSNVHGLVIGEAQHKSYEAELLALAAASGVQKHLTFLGYRNDTREIISLSNLVLSLSSEPESFGRTVLEALCLGKPVIGYDMGGTTEILSAMFPEGIVAHKNATEAVQKIKLFMANPPQVNPQCPFTLEQMLDNTLAIYQELATGLNKP